MLPPYELEAASSRSPRLSLSPPTKEELSSRLYSKMNSAQVPRARAERALCAHQLRRGKMFYPPDIAGTERLCMYLSGKKRCALLMMCQSFHNRSAIVRKHVRSYSQDLETVERHRKVVGDE